MSTAEKRLHTLLTDRAIAGLDEAQQAELKHLLVGATIDPSYESAAAAIELSLMAHAEAMPAAVKAAVLEQASHYWGFMVPRRHERTIGGGAPMPTPGAELSLDASDDVLLGDTEPEGWDDDDDDDDVDDVDAVDDAESPESIDAAVESGVLESSLTNGRIDQVRRAKRAAKSSEPQRGETPPDLQELRPGASPSARRSSQPHPPQPDPEPNFEPAPPSGSHENLDPRSVSQSDLGPAASHSEIVRMPVSESRLIRVATYISAIAALVMLAIALWLFAHRGDPPDTEDLRTQVEAASDKLEWTFTTKQDPAVGEGAGGSVVWSSEAQVGVMTLRGLEPTGSGETQYQVWIVDNKREGPPVNGGVFDVIDETELEIPIHTKLVIGEPSAFVITVEHAGGVVLSTQERVVMVATGP